MLKVLTKQLIKFNNYAYRKTELNTCKCSRVFIIIAIIYNNKQSVEIPILSYKEPI